MNKEIIHKAYILFFSGIKDENGIVKVNDDNQIIGIQFLNNSFRDYIVYWYYESGKIKYQGQYKDDKLHGDYIGYYENGQISYHNQYKNNKRHGDFIWYYENGQIRYQGQYKNGELIE